MKSFLPATWDVPREIADRIGAKVGRQRVMSSGGHLLLVLHAPPAPGADSREGRVFWRKPDGSWLSSDLGPGSKALADHLDQFVEIVEDQERFEERASGATAYFSIIGALAPIHRTVRNLHAALAEARKVCPEDRDLIDLRDRAYELERTVEILYHGAKNGLEFTIARRAEEEAVTTRRMAAAAYRLNILAAFFFPLATLSALFGANLLHGLEKEPPPGPFLALAGAGLFLGIVLFIFVTRKPRPPGTVSGRGRHQATHVSADGEPPARRTRYSRRS